MDIWRKKKRSQVMSRILGKNTKPELQVRKMLSSLGYRYRLHVKGLPGKPDIVIKKYNTVIFVHGCFWHLHSKCRDGTIPKTRTGYWQEKLLQNKKRDANHIKALRAQGWEVLRLWECEIEKRPDRVMKRIGKIFLKVLEGTTPTFKQEDIQLIVKRLYDLGKKDPDVKRDANDICNTYGTRGIHFLKDLFYEYQ